MFNFSRIDEGGGGEGGVRAVPSMEAAPAVIMAAVYEQWAGWAEAATHIEEAGKRLMGE